MIFAGRVIFLGAEQSGFITDIGFEMYTKILDDAVRELKETEFSTMFSSEPKPVDLPDTQIEFDHSAYIENSYVTDNVERLNLYRKLSEAKDASVIDDWEEEVKDRFGPMPESTVYLLLATRLKVEASQRLVKKVTTRALAECGCRCQKTTLKQVNTCMEKDFSRLFYGT